MKRKFFSVLLALVLVCSFSLVAAVPVAAQATLNVHPLTLDIKTGDSIAQWSTTQVKNGSYSAYLDTGTTTQGDGDEARIEIIMPSGMTLDDLDTISWWVYAVSGYPPHLDITLDCDGDDVVDNEDMLTAEMNLNCVGAPKSIATLTGEISYSTGWLQTFELTSADGFGAINDSTTFWVTKMGSGDLNAPSGTLGQWKAGTVANDPESEMTTPVIDGTAELVKLEIEVDNWVVNSDVYVDDVTINGVVWYGLIQDAIDTATAAGDTISVAAGTYDEDLVIPATKTNLELVGATGATIKGVVTEPDASFPLAVPNIDILASGVKIHGFTIEGPDDVSGEYASGMLIGASNVEIYDNAFKVTAGRATWAGGAISNGIITYRKTAIPTVDISGLNIHDNTFTNHGTGVAGFDAIFINLDTGTTTATIADNDFTGNLNRAIIVERSNMVISGNSIITDLAPRSGSAGSYKGILIGCWPVGSDPGPVQSNVSVTGNIVKGSSSGKGFTQGIRIGHSTQLGLTNITVLRNVVEGTTGSTGIKINPDASGVAVNYNEITGNDVGVQNDDAGVELDAQYNWYGGVAGPPHATNPYVTEAAGNDTVSDDVDFLPWMIHDTLVSGWNIYSTPIAPGAASNTVEKALDLWGDDTGSLIIGWYFDGATQDWVQVLSTTALQPMQAVYLKMTAAATIDVVLSAEYTSPPQAVMGAGWNLIGPAALEPMLVEDALLSAKFGAGAPDLWGYSQAHSPALHQTLWTFQREDPTPSSLNLIPTEGYWVHMVNAGLLAGFTSTPIEP